MGIIFQTLSFCNLLQKAAGVKDAVHSMKKLKFTKKAGF